MFTPTRDEARRFLFDSWAKFRHQQALTPLEKLTVEVLVKHPEYHRVFENAEANSDKEYSPEMGETNPFLHISMHLSIAEQLSIDQPPGIKQFYEALTEKHQDSHAAEHDIMDCLGEMLWQAQRQRTMPNPAHYFACLQGKLGQQDSAELPTLPSDMTGDNQPS